MIDDIALRKKNGEQNSLVSGKPSRLLSSDWFLAKPAKISSDQVNKLFGVFVAFSAYTIWQTL